MYTSFFRLPGLILLLCLLSNGLFAQRRIFKVNPGQLIGDVIPSDFIYAYPGFADGAVVMKDGRVARGRLNYNALYGDIQFIDPKGDTLSLDNEKMIDVVAVNEDSFFYDNGYIKSLGQVAGVRLGSMRFFTFLNRQKIGGFGELSSGSIETQDRISSGGTVATLQAAEVLTLAENTVYLIGDAYHHFSPVNKKSLMRFFPKKETIMHQYFANNKVDFSDEQAIRQLISFIQAGSDTAR